MHHLARLETMLEVKADESTGRIEGYGAIFGNVDGNGDIVAPGAFEVTLAQMAETARKLPMLWQHDAADPIGVWESTVADDVGLRVAGTVLRETTRGRDVFAFLRHGAVQGLSIGYLTRDASVDRQTGIRTITEAELWEVSVVTFPANAAALVDSVKLRDAVASMTERDIERALRDAGLSARDAKAAVSRAMDLGAARDAPKLRSAVGLELRLAQLARIMAK